jgi:hypothetical protein
MSAYQNICRILASKGDNEASKSMAFQEWLEEGGPKGFRCNGDEFGTPSIPSLIFIPSMLITPSIQIPGAMFAWFKNDATRSSCLEKFVEAYQECGVLYFD